MIHSVFRISHGLPEGTTLRNRCSSCGADFDIYPMALMALYQVVITGLGGWLGWQALQLEGGTLQRIFMGIAVFIIACALPLAWVTVRRLNTLRAHPVIET